VTQGKILGVVMDNTAANKRLGKYWRSNIPQCSSKGVLLMAFTCLLRMFRCDKSQVKSSCSRLSWWLSIWGFANLYFHNHHVIYIDK
jgi:hypothetical protein